jgi:hypothetical protein
MPADITGVQICNRQHCDPFNIPRRLIDILVVAANSHQTTTLNLQILQGAHQILCPRFLEIQPINYNYILGQKLCQHRRVSRQLSLLAGHAPTEVAGHFGKGNTAANAFCGSAGAGSRHTSPLLPEDLSGRAGYHTSALGRGRANPLVGVIHNNGLLKQWIPDATTEHRLINAYGVDLFAVCAVNS